MNREKEFSPGIPHTEGENENKFYNVIIRSAEIGSQSASDIYVRRVKLADVIMLLQLFCGQYYCEVYDYDGDGD